MSEIINRLGSKPNTGHGHVFPREDGKRARCGGPGNCNDCSTDQVQLTKALESAVPAVGGGAGLQAGSMTPGIMNVVNGLAGSITGVSPPPQDNSTGDRPDLPPYTAKLDPDVNSEADNYFPTNHLQVQQLVGKMLTHIEALGVPAGQEKAAKDLVRQSIYGWFADVQENSVTSYRGCIAPIQMLRHNDGTERKAVWLAVGDHAVSVG